MRVPVRSLLPITMCILGLAGGQAAAQGAPAPGAAPAPAQSEFARRAGHGSGFYITRERIDRMHPEHTVDLFRGVPGMDVRGSGIRMRQGNTTALTGRSSFGLGGGASNACPAGVESSGCGVGGAPGRSSDCAPTVFMDGALSPGGASDLNTVAPAELEGIEVYGRPNTAPAQYRRDSDQCAIVLIWRKQAPTAVVPAPAP